MTQRKIKFWRYYKQWYETYKLGDVRSVTYDKYELTGRWIKKLAPDLMLDQMTRTDLQRLINAYGQTHEKATVRDFYRHLGAAINDAVYEGWIRKTPCYKIRITSQVASKKKIKWLEVDEVKRLEKIFRKDKTGFGDFFDFSLRTGLRFAETLGLTPNDVDFDNMTIDVNKSLNYKADQESGQFQPTKNKYSNRIIAIDKQAVKDLKKHISGVADTDSIWSAWYQKENGTKVYNSIFNDRLTDMCAQADVHRISVHGLRHTHASLLIANRVSVQSVAKRLGHADTETTQRVYIHLLEKLANEDNSKIMTIMAGL